MPIASPLKGLAGWITYKLWVNYWSLPVLAAAVAVPFALLVLALDRWALTAWILANDLSPVSTADTAKDFAGVASGVDAAFISLYFSITLIVLSLAAGNLGVRLIDRWLTKRLVRVSLAGLAFSLIVSLVAMLTIDAEAPLSDVPLGLLAIVMALQVVNVAMLSVSLHDLGRTMFIDSSIEALFTAAAQREIDLQPGEPIEGEWSHVLRAERDGYVEGVDVDKIARRIGETDCRICILAAPGQHIMRGQPLIKAEARIESMEGLHRLIPLGRYRSDSQGVVFRVRLLVEIAARALSPAVNDFYTALACADRLTAIMAQQAGTWIDPGKAVMSARYPGIELPGRDFAGLFEDPMNAFRQAAAQYPSVSIRMIDNYERLAERLIEEGTSPGLLEYLHILASDLCHHAQSVSGFEGDRHDIGAALAAFERTLRQHEPELALDGEAQQDLE
ncbi:DUF2254 family protein [Qipengyuania sp. JC766]|uniref:DUF2254 family protein n=1 Tax=Qipengyuania sp. JC766 TaxID=3232139 RepID=UPI00345A3CD5